MSNDIIEIWKDIPGFNGLYKVSNLGRVKSFVRSKPKILSIKSGDRYLSIKLCDGVFIKRFLVHRLVASTFIPNINNAPQVNHINGLKHDNRSANLEWCTGTQNMAHAHKLGLINTPFGELHHNSKLSNNQVIQIRFAYQKGEITYKELGKKYKVSTGTITEIINRQIWKHL